MVRAAAALALLALPGCGGAPARVPHAVARPVRVMSLNQCTDQLVLALLPPSRIASVTWLSRDPRYSAMVAAARRVPANRGGVEEVAAARPDLIVTDTFSGGPARALLHRLGYPILEIPDAMDVAAVRANVRTLAAALGERARGEALVAALDRDLAPFPGRSVPVAVWTRDGIAAPPLLGAALAAAGFVNVAAGRGDVEALLAAHPRYLVTTAEPGASLGDNVTAHPAVAARWPATRRLAVRAADTICGTPALGHAARMLRAQREARG